MNALAHERCECHVGLGPVLQEKYAKNLGSAEYRYLGRLNSILTTGQRAHGSWREKFVLGMLVNNDAPLNYYVKMLQYF